MPSPTVKLVYHNDGPTVDVTEWVRQQRMSTDLVVDALVLCELTGVSPEDLATKRNYFRDAVRRVWETPR